MDAKVVMYSTYLAISIGLTIWVGRTLSRSGKVFLDDAFGNERLADSVNHLLVVGFYLLNLGYVSVAMRDGRTVTDTESVMEALSKKLGLVLLVLGVVHLFNVFALGRYRRNRLAASTPAAAPTTVPPRPAISPEQAWANYYAAQGRQRTAADLAQRTAQPPAEDDAE
jgi:hypothetical protein